MDTPRFDGYDENGIPFIIMDGHIRKLACLPNRRLSRLPKLSATLPTIAEKDWVEIDRTGTDATVGILDQNGYNSCVGNQGAGATMRARLASGYDHVPLGVGYLYSLINGGRDAGANLDDCIVAMQKYGCCPAAIVGQSPFYPSQMPANAATEAARFRVDLALSCEGYDDLMSGLQLGGIPCYAVCVDGTYAVGSNGIARTYPRWQSNHAQHADGARIVAGSMCLDNVNSWGVGYGRGGRNYLARSNFGTGADGCYVVFHVIQDPSAPMTRDQMIQHIASRAPTSTTVAPGISPIA